MSGGERRGSFSGVWGWKGSVPCPKPLPQNLVLLSNSPRFSLICDFGFVSENALKKHMENGDKVRCASLEEL